MENEYLKRAKFEDYIKDFKTRGIVKENGTIDDERYQAWFARYLAESEANTIREKIEIIEEANFIAKEACRDLQVKDDNIPHDGNMNDEKINQLILKGFSKEQIKEELKTVFNVLLKDKKEEEKKEDKDDKKDSSEDNNEDSDNDATDNVGEEELYKACLLLLPVIRQMNLNDDLNQQKSDPKPEEEYKDLLKEYGFNEKQIKAAMDGVTKKITEDEKERKKNKEETYNAYNDWRYIYYMSTLGKGFSIYYDVKAPTLSQIISKSLSLAGKAVSMTARAKSNEKNNESFYSAAMKKSKDPEMKQVQDKFLLNVMKFRSNYEVDVDKEALTEDILHAKTKDDLTKVYKNYLTQYYLEGRRHIKDFPTFVKDFDSLIKNACEFTDNKFYSRFCGMKGEQMMVFTLELREREYNISQRLVDEVTGRFGEIKNISGDALTDFLEQKFNEATNKVLNAQEGDEPMRDAMACYLLLKETHEGRGKSYMFAHPINYYKEAKSVERMKEIMDNHIKASKNDEEVEEFKEMERRHTVYNKAFKSEEEALRTFSLEIDQIEKIDLEDVRDDSRMVIETGEENAENVIEQNMDNIEKEPPQIKK